jgi:hypothetical protein
VGGYAPLAREDSVSPRHLTGASGRLLNFTVRSQQESPLATSALVFNACVMLGLLSWCVAAFLFVRARRDYRGPSGPASWLSPFAMWESTNYEGAGAVRIRRSWICFIVFVACIVTAFLVAQLSDGGRLW